MKTNLTIKLDDQGQDFIELKVDADGKISGYSPMFADGRLSLIGIGALDGTQYHTREELMRGEFEQNDDLFVYFKTTGEKDPLPWNANTLKYSVKGVK